MPAVGKMKVPCSERLVELLSLSPKRLDTKGFRPHGRILFVMWNSTNRTLVRSSCTFRLAIRTSLKIIIALAGRPSVRYTRASPLL